MKKLIAAALTLSLLISVVSVSAFAAGNDDDCDLTIAVASDLHYNTPRQQLAGSINDPVYWYANRKAALEDESGFIIDEFLAQCAADDEIEYILLSGDFVDNGESTTKDMEEVAAKLLDFENKTGKQIFVINGNHDFGGEGSAVDIAKFKEIFAQLGYDHALVIDEDTGSYTADLGEKYRLIALDSCDPNEDGDGLTMDRVQWACEQAEIAETDGRYPILMMHHNFLDHLPWQRLFSTDFIVRNHYTTAELFADAGIKLAFTGHEHASDVTSFTSAAGNVIYDFLTCSLSMYPTQYRVISLSDEEIDYEVRTVDSIDTDALTSQVSGYSAEQIDLMNAGFNAYAKGFLKAGLKYRFENTLTAKKLGVSEDDIYYDLVDSALSGITDIMGMPYYGENSVQALAAGYDIDIPDSAYENGWDLVTELLSAHYAGDEAYDLDSTETVLLLKTVSLILKTELSSVSDSAFLGAAQAILAECGTEYMSDELQNIGESVFGNVTAGEYFVLALCSPLLYEFAYDDDGVGDNYGTLDGYGTVSLESNINNIAANMETVSSKAILHISLVLKYLKVFLSTIHIQSLQ